MRPNSGDVFAHVFSYIVASVLGFRRANYVEEKTAELWSGQGTRILALT